MPQAGAPTRKVTGAMMWLQMSATSVARVAVHVELVARRIYVVRSKRVMLDRDLAELYQVETFNLNKAVKRNPERFPEDFMFQLSREESEGLRFQNGIPKEEGRGGSRYRPYAFTEQGVAMLSSVLRSSRAAQMNVFIMRAFVKLREVLATNRELARKVQQLSAAQQDHASLFEIVIQDMEKLDKKFTREIRRLKGPRRQKAKIGFLAPATKKV